VKGTTNVYRIKSQKLNRLRGKPRCRWKGTIKMGHEGMCPVNVDWTGSGYDQEATACGDKNRTLLGYYAVLSGNSLPTFRDKLSFPSSMIKMGTTGSR